MDTAASRFRYINSGARYLVIVDGAVIGAVEKHIGPGRGYPGSKQIRSEQTTTWDS